MEIDNKKVLISAIIVALVVLVSFNFEKMTGQATATSNSRIIQVVGGTSAGSSVDIVVAPVSGVMNLGGSYKEGLWLKGPGLTKAVSNYACTKGYTNTCKEAQATTWLPSDAAGVYYFTVEKTTKTGRQILAQKAITI